MNTTIEALQNLYVSKGGNLPDVDELTTIPEMIEAIADISEEEGQAITSDEINEIINGIN